MKPKRKQRPRKPRQGQFDGGKVEGRLTAEEAEALAAYMGERFLTNKSDVLRSVLAQFLAREGYLEPPAKRAKRGGDGISAKKTTGGTWGKMARRIALVMTAPIAWLGIASALTNSQGESVGWPMAMANGDFRAENGEQACAVGGGVAARAREVTDWFLDLEPGYQAAITVTTSLVLDFADGKLQLLGGLQLW